MRLVGYPFANGGGNTALRSRRFKRPADSGGGNSFVRFCPR